MRRVPALAVGVVAAVLLLPSCQPAAPRNLILISIDTLRADHLGCYGYERPTSPNIDAVADGGTIFDDASATSPWTLPSHASLLTGLYPRRHGAISPGLGLAAETVHLAAWLADHDFRTSAVVNSSWLETHGLREGFEDFVYVPEGMSARSPSRVTDLALLRLHRFDRATPFFLFLHYYDVHSDYRSLREYEQQFVGDYDGFVDGSTAQLIAVLRGETKLTEDDAQHLRDLYDAGIRQLDDQLARIFRDPRLRSLLDETLLVITSDHGEEFLERGSVLHGRTQYQEVIRIPLVFAGPGIPKATRIAAPVSLVDVMPTILTHLGVSVPARLDGVDLQPLWSKSDDEPAKRPLYLDASQRRADAEGPIEKARTGVRWGRFKLHRNHDTGESRLFDLAADPRERVDVEEANPELSARLLGFLEAYLAERPANARREEFRQEERRRLEALGYLQ
jgi:arylsulfatase A-like enzyme